MEQRSLRGTPPVEIRKVSLESSAVAAADAVRQLHSVPANSGAAQLRLHIPLGAIREGAHLPQHWETSTGWPVPTAWHRPRRFGTAQPRPGLISRGG
eukprot:8987935-Pyramimonas_sp.AAC.1